MSKQVNAACPAMEMLHLLSEKHVAFLLYTLKDKPMGFCDLQAQTSINTATLSRRLQTLCQANLVSRCPCTTDTRQTYYSLTKRGARITRLLAQIGSV